MKTHTSSHLTANRLAALLLACLLTAFAVSGCHHKTKSNDAVSSVQVQEPTANGIPDDLFSYSISIDGHLYTFPCPVSELTGNGWKVWKEHDLAPGETDDYCDFIKNDVFIDGRVYNASSKGAGIGDCTLVGIDIFTNESLSIVLPGGLVFDDNTTVDDVIAKYGTPEEQNSVGGFVRLSYIDKYSKVIKISIVKPENRDEWNRNYVSIANRKVKNDQSRPDYSGMEPVTIDDALVSYQFWMDGHLYTMPVAFTEFTENGWEYGGVSPSVPSKKYLYAERMKKGDSKIWVSIYNPTEKELPISECVITSVEVEFSEGISYVILPGGFVFDRYTTVEEVKKQYGQPMEITEYEDYSLLSYDNDFDPNQSITFKIMTEDSVLPPSYSSVALRKPVDTAS